MMGRILELRCESLVSPNGIDTRSPEFSWVVESDSRDCCFSEFQVQVSSEHELLLKDAPDVWDSGKVMCERPNAVRYAGPLLESCKEYFWRVKCWDESVGECLCSRIDRFSTGFISEEWSARWITTSKPIWFRSRATVLLGKKTEGHLHAYAVYFRKEFSSSKPVSKALLFSCGLGYHVVYLNGCRVGTSVLDPAQTDYRKWALYSSHDVTEFIRETNMIGMILGNGRHIKTFGYEQPKGIVELRLIYGDGTVEKVVTDDSWKTFTGPVTKNGIYYGEHYDARKEQKGWNRPGDFDDSCWVNAVEAEPVKLRAQTMEPVKVMKEILPVSVYSPSAGSCVFDFGQNVTGWVKLSVRGSRGAEVTIRYSELLNPDCTLNVQNLQNAEAMDTYILKGEGEEIYQPEFTYHGFRYVELKGYPGVPSPENLVACFAHSSVENTGVFFCEDPLINRIHDCVVRGQKSNLMSIPTDCPQRDERHGWLGDIQLVVEEAILNFGMLPFFRKYLEDISLSQREDGALSDVVPPYYSLYPADPAWGTAYITIAWSLYLYYGDLETLRKHYSGMKKYLDFLSGIAKDDIVEFGKYGDWCPPGSVLPKRTPVALTSTWYYYHDTLMFSKICEVLSRSEESRIYRERAEHVKIAFNERFLREDHYEATKVTPEQKLDDAELSQTSNILPLALGMVPDNCEAKVLKRLLDNIIRNKSFHIDTGILGTRYILEVLAEKGYIDAAYKIVTQKTYPGWGYMIEQGATTLWERWENLAGSGMNSHNHIMLGSVDKFFYEWIAGISSMKTAWKKMLFRTPLFRRLRFAKALLMTPFGKAAISWERMEEHLKLVVDVPVSSEAEVHIPRAEQGKVYESGNILDKSSCSSIPGIRSISCEEGVLKVNVGSGRYLFVSEI